MGFLTTEAEDFAVLRQVKERIGWNTFDSDERLLKKLNEKVPELEKWVESNVP